MENPNRIEETYNTYNFLPNTLVFFREDVEFILKSVHSVAPRCEMQIGLESLEKSIELPADIDRLAPKEGEKPTAYHSLYVHLTDPKQETKPDYLILEISPSYYHLYLSDKNNASLLKLFEKFQQFLAKKNVFKTFRNRFVDFVIFGFDVLILSYIVALQDIIDRALGFTLPEYLLLLVILLVNLVFVVPHGKNRFYLTSENKVSYFAKKKENIFISATILCIGVVIFLIVKNILG